MVTWSRVWFMLAALAAALRIAGPAAPARAQTTTETREARAAFDEGRTASAEERWIDALAAFERSRALVERPSTVFNLAAVLVRLGRAREALAALDDLARIADARRDAAVLAQATELRASATASLRHVRIRVAPPDARLEVDGVPVEAAGEERALELDPGAHGVVASREGHAEARYELPVGVEVLEIVLEPLPATLEVRSNAPAATVRIDGEVRGTGSARAELAPGAHTVALEAEGFLPFEREVRLGPGESTTLDAALEPVPPAEDIASSPLFWGLAAGGVAVVVGVAIGVAFATAGEGPPYGGTSNVVLAPLVVF